MSLFFWCLDLAPGREIARSCSPMSWCFGVRLPDHVPLCPGALVGDDKTLVPDVLVPELDVPQCPGYLVRDDITLAPDVLVPGLGCSAMSWFLGMRWHNLGAWCPGLDITRQCSPMSWFLGVSLPDNVPRCPGSWMGDCQTIFPYVPVPWCESTRPQSLMSWFRSGRESQTSAPAYPISSDRTFKNLGYYYLFGYIVVSFNILKYILSAIAYCRRFKKKLKPSKVAFSCFLIWN